MKYSIIIPTYNHCDDLLIPCVESIFKYTNMNNVELVISANGCTDNTKNYLEHLEHKFNDLGFSSNFKYVWNDAPLGYPKATNEGLKVCTGEYIVLLNNDTVLLNQTKNTWLDLLEAPFKHDVNAGIVGPIKEYSPEANSEFIIFFCAMIHRRVFNRLGLLNEDYGIGSGEDTEFSIEALRAGFSIYECGEKKVLDASSYTGEFPIYHCPESTMRDTSLVKDWDIQFKNNGRLLHRKYNPMKYKESLMNNYERYIALNGEPVDPREQARYLWASQLVVGNSMLEVGCSNGYGSQFFKNMQYTGLDYDKDIIEAAEIEKWGTTKKFVHADINTFPMKYYDTIVAFEVIEHLDNGLEIVNKLKKFCSRLLISVPYKEVPGFWGEHHKLHMLDESHFPGFEFKFINRSGQVTDYPLDSMINLMLCKYDAPR